MNALVKDVMTTRVMWVGRDTPFAAVAAALRNYRISAFPVLDEDSRVIGVVSESDLLAKLALSGGEGTMPGMITGILHHKEMEKARAVTAAELMTDAPVTVVPDDTVEHAARLMYLRNVKRLPVVDSGGHLLGIVSRTDVLAVYDRTDDEIADEIRKDVLRGEAPADPGALDVTVTDGVVTLVGNPETIAQGRKIVREAHHVQGVVAVRDRFEYPEPGPDPFDVVASFAAD
jgi:CBS domain-containing protein